MELPQNDADNCQPMQDGRFPEAELTGVVIGCFYRVRRGLKSGHLESVYRNAMALELRRANVEFQTEAPVDVYYDGVRVGYFRADIIVARKVVVEIKASERLVDADRRQLTNYLRCTDLEVGLLLHFGPKSSFERIVFSNINKDMLPPRE